MSTLFVLGLLLAGPGDLDAEQTTRFGGLFFTRASGEIRVYNDAGQRVTRYTFPLPDNEPVWFRERAYAGDLDWRCRHVAGPKGGKPAGTLLTFTVETPEGKVLRTIRYVIEHPSGRVWQVLPADPTKPD